MKVILQRDVPKLGKDGEIVNVADGYARNYLFPRSYAVPASGGAMKAHTARANMEKAKGDRALHEAEAGAAKMQGLRITLIGRVGSGTKLYGSITAQDIADAIQRETGLAVDKRRVGLADPIKTLGTYTVAVRLHTDVSVPVTVQVFTEEERERQRQQEALAAAAAAKAAAETPAESATLPTADEAAAQSAG